VLRALLGPCVAPIRQNSQHGRKAREERYA
jgi:hypothetical protein